MIKKYFIAIILLIIFLAAFLPLASSNPDGIAKVASSLGIQQTPIWQGIMNNYSFPTLENSYVSTLLAGILGTIFVFATTLVLGTIVTKRSHMKNEKS